ncbi:electron transport complex subunit RsxD [Gilvimarinus sp. F26214L]|uniref:electron transport complex subunit RsxD n=1 Tax=Gilvimarinus sp. DZF01 TaxID=3461371 RepID=UPI0040461EA8
MMPQITSPHAHSQNSTARIMQWVLLATVPGLAALTHFFGPGTLYNLVLAGVTALLCEAAMLKLRGRPIGFYLRDCSALVTAALLALALPPYCPWWIVVVGTATAIVLAKHLYGGLGYNPFNPAMVGYVVLLISFPVEMTTWAAPRSVLAEGENLMGPISALARIFLETPVDAYSGATPLDLFKHQEGLTVQGIYEAEPVFARAEWAGAGWEWVNLGFLAGGLFLLYKKVFTWHTPVSMLATLGLMAAVFYDGGSSASGGSPLFHWLSGGTMLGAFFIATDPVTSATSRRGKLIFGACIGVLIYVIRSWGSYPDAVAFAVLLMNFAAPFIDYYTVPRSYGHARSRPGTGH